MQLEHQDKAATLLGMLVSFAEQLPENIGNDDLETFKQKGLQLLKQN